MKSRFCKTGFIHPVALLSVATTLMADGGRKWSFGVQGNLGMPIGSLSDAASDGAGLSLFTERRLTDRQAFSISLGYVAFGGKDLDARAEFDDGTIVPSAARTRRNIAVNAMWNYLFRFESNDEGPYILLGTGLGFWLAAQADWVGGMYNYSLGLKKFSTGAMPICLGVGANQSRNIGMEVKYFFLPGAKYEVIGRRYSPPQEVSVYSAAVHYVQCGIHCRF